MANPLSTGSLDRRRLLQALAAAGLAPLFARALSVLVAAEGRVTHEMLEQAAWISGLELDEAERELMLEDVGELLGDFERLRAVELDNAVPPALSFDPDATASSQVSDAVAPDVSVVPRPQPAVARPDGDDELAFLPVTALASLLRQGEVSSVELTRLYLERLERYDPLLRCVITRTEELAHRQAERADRELAEGRDRGVLHGIPWAVKDLFAVPGYRTTWGAAPYAAQVRPETATAVRRLEEAGAVLIAKTSVGALAWGDVWVGGKTRSPWNPEQGSSGSSAGSAAATAAGLAGFTLGTETWGSIVSPCHRCGATGLRPSFGRVSRHGVMALAWSMDKVGPIARSAEECALVLGAIHGADGLDPSAVDRPFLWPAEDDPRSLRVGYVASLFDRDRGAGVEDETAAAAAREWAEIDRATLATLAELGFELVPIELPNDLPIRPLSLILTAEAATAFDELTRSGRDDELVRQERFAWPNTFRQGQLIPAVEYLRANRVRTLLAARMAELFATVDLYLSPTYGGDNLLATNLTGHPQVVLPNGFGADGTPRSITLTGRLWGESELLAVAAAFQDATDFHRRRPPLERWREELDNEAQS